MTEPVSVPNKLADLRAAAERAKAWRPEACSDRFCPSTPDTCRGCEPCGQCPSCLCAQRAVEDIARNVDLVDHYGFDSAAMRYYSIDAAEFAARVASYFCAEPNPVSEFRDLVREACR